MHVSANVRHSDLAWLNLYMAPRQRGVWIYFGIITAACFAFMLWLLRPVGSGTIMLAAVTGVLAGIAGTVVGSLSTLAHILAQANEKSGVLGPRTYSLRDDGIQYQSGAGESLLRWSAIDSVHKLKNYVFIGLTSSVFWIVPRRAFNSPQEFDNFCTTAHARWQAAQASH
jgi:hypothetical protein